MVQPIQLIVGLGNPGREYEQTRHNVGCWFIKALVEQYNIIFRSEAKFKGLTCQININDHKCWVLFPITYMNLCGEAVKALANFYNITPETILVVHDDLDFAPGIIRLKKDGGHGGHKGLRSIINHLHSNKFYRLRIGIGHPRDRNAVVEYVLRHPSRSDKQLIENAIDNGIQVIPEIVAGNIEKAMTILHS